MTSFEARTSSPCGGIIEVRLDGADGPVLGACQIGYTGDWQKWGTFKTTIAKTAGKHTVCLRMITNPFSGDYDKAASQLATIDKWIKRAPSPACRARLAVLRCRIAAAKDHIELNRDFDQLCLEGPAGRDALLGGEFHPSRHRRFLVGQRGQHREPVRATQLCEERAAVAQGLEDSAAVRRHRPRTALGSGRRMENEQPEAKGFHVYRDDTRLTAEPLPPTAQSYADTFYGVARYTVTVVGPGRRGERAFGAGAAARRARPTTRRRTSS